MNTVAHITLKNIRSIDVHGTVHAVCPGCGLLLGPGSTHLARCVIQASYTGRHRP